MAKRKAQRRICKGHKIKVIVCVHDEICAIMATLLCWLHLHSYTIFKKKCSEAETSGID